MRIIIFTHAISRHTDDHPQFINELALAYQDAGHTVKIVTASHHTINLEQLDSRLDIHRYRYAPKPWERLGYGQSLDSDLMLEKSSFLFAPMMFIAGAWSLWRTIASFRPDFVHVHWALPNGPMAALATRLTKTPYIISFPGSDVTVMGSNPLLRAIGRFACYHATLLTTNSHDLRDAVVSYGVPQKKFHFVLYGSETAAQPADHVVMAKIQKQHALDSAIPTILAIGRMVPKKGFRHLIDATATLVQRGYTFRIVLIGEGPLKEKLQQQCHQLNLGDTVLFVGKIAYSQLPHWYHLADIFTMPAVKNPADGLNVVVTEAMKYALPIVATNIGGNELVIQHGKNGRLCSPENPLALADELQAMLIDRKSAKKMGLQAHQTFLNRANWKSIVNRYLTLLRPYLLKT